MSQPIITALGVQTSPLTVHMESRNSPAAQVPNQKALQSNTPNAPNAPNAPQGFVGDLFLYWSYECRGLHGAVDLSALTNSSLHGATAGAKAGATGATAGSSGATAGSAGAGATGASAGTTFGSKLSAASGVGSEQGAQSRADWCRIWFNASAVAIARLLHRQHVPGFTVYTSRMQNMLALSAINKVY